MERFFAVLLLGAASAQMTGAQNQGTPMPTGRSELAAEGLSPILPALPVVPRGKSTILGGEIRDVDTVRDQFRLQIAGQRPLKILFDERTQVYLDGKTMPLRNLASADHASLQTVLDGTEVFAVSIHLMSQPPQGVYECQVLNYNASSRELSVNNVLSSRPISLQVPSDTAVTRIGQSAFTAGSAGRADLVKGTLISLNFEPGKNGQDVATRIDVLATPGSIFVFTGSLASLDKHTGLLVLIDSAGDKRYEVAFDSALLPKGSNLKPGDSLRVSAAFNDARYVATMIALY